VTTAVASSRPNSPSMQGGTLFDVVEADRQQPGTLTQSSGMLPFTVEESSVTFPKSLKIPPPSTQVLGVEGQGSIVASRHYLRRQVCQCLISSAQDETVWVRAERPTGGLPGHLSLTPTNRGCGGGRGMSRCPMCGSFQIVVEVSPWPSAWCDRCGARWIQEGTEQLAVHRPDASSPNISGVSIHPARPLVVLPEKRTP
jgi:hypothetical protein